MYTPQLANEGVWRGALQGHGQRRATCRCTQSTELFTVNIKDFQRILSPLQHGTLQAKITFLKQVPLSSQDHLLLLCMACSAG